MSNHIPQEKRKLHHVSKKDTGLILSLHPANVKRRYNVTPSFNCLRLPPKPWLQDNTSYYFKVLWAIYVFEYIFTDWMTSIRNGSCKTPQQFETHTWIMDITKLEPSTLFHIFFKAYIFQFESVLFNKKSPNNEYMIEYILKKGWKFILAQQITQPFDKWMIQWVTPT